MPPFIILGVGLVFATFVAVFLNFRLLLYPLIPSLNPLTHAEQLNLSGSTLFISDLHLRAGGSFRFAKDLRNFAETMKVSNLVIVGDLFDSRKDARRILGNGSFQAFLEMLGLYGLPINIFWVTGSPVHDPVGIAASHLQVEGVKILDQCALLRLDRSEVIAYHGHDLSNIGAIGHAWDRFVMRLGLEKLWRQVAKADERAWVVFGHTHIPGLDVERRIANCGGWVTVPLLVRPSGTGILFPEGQELPQLVQIS